MQTQRTRETERRLNDLLTLDHSLNGGILFGLDGNLIEIQARAMKVLSKPAPWTAHRRIRHGWLRCERGNHQDRRCFRKAEPP